MRPDLILSDIDMDLHDSAADECGDLGQFILICLDGCGKFAMRKNLSLCHRHQFELYTRQLLGRETQHPGLRNR